MNYEYILPRQDGQSKLVSKRFQQPKIWASQAKLELIQTSWILCQSVILESDHHEDLFSETSDEL